MAGDDEASRYETDLLALAALTIPAGPADTAGPPAADSRLEAELAGFTALLTGHPDTGTDTATATGTGTGTGTGTDGDAAGDRPQVAS